MMEKFEKCVDDAKKKRKNCVDEPQVIIAHKMFTDDESTNNEKKNIECSRAQFQVFKFYIYYIFNA